LDLFSRNAAYAAVCGLVLAAPAFAAERDPPDDPFTGSVTFANDYVYRGISQSNGQPAYMGAAEYSHAVGPETGVFAGGFISNVDFFDGHQARVEVSPYVGVKGQHGAFSWRVQAYYNAYPGTPSRLHYNYYSLDASVGRDFGSVALSVEADVDPNLFGNSGLGFYAGLDATVPLPDMPFAPNLVVHGGRQSIARNALYGTPDYTDWALELNADIRSIHLALRYSDSDIPRPQCFGGARVCGGRAVASIGWTF
jgi:uncharacterized protein (TIGR02001 family)